MCVCVTVEHVKIKVKADDYMPFLGSQLSLRFILNIDSGDLSVTTMKVVNLKTKDLNLRVTHTQTSFYYLCKDFQRHNPSPSLNPTLT